MMRGEQLQTLWKFLRNTYLNEIVTVSVGEMLSLYWRVEYLMKRGREIDIFKRGVVIGEP